MNSSHNNSSSNDRFQVVSDSFRDDSLSTTEDIGGVGKARPNLEAVDFAPKRFDRVRIKRLNKTRFFFKKVKQN